MDSKYITLEFLSNPKSIHKEFEYILSFIQNVRVYFPIIYNILIFE